MSQSYYFIRHATPENDAERFNMIQFERDMQGKSDFPLSQKGILQAEAIEETIKSLGLDVIMSSNLKRSIETAQLICTQTGIPYGEEIPELKELTMGTYSKMEKSLFNLLISILNPIKHTKIYSDMLYEFMSTYFLYKWFRGKTTGGDTLTDIQEKIDLTLKKLDQLPGNKIGIVGHGYWIFFMAMNLMGMKRRNILKLSFINNCSLTRVDLDNSGRHQLKYFALNHTDRKING